MEFERNTCDRCTRICYVCVLGTSKLCDLCLEAMIHDPDSKKIMESLFLALGEKFPMRQMEIDE